MDTDLIDRWSELGETRWGIDDCVTVVADEVQCLTGRDPIAAFRPNGERPWQQCPPNVLRCILAGVRLCPWLVPVPPKSAPLHSVGIARADQGWAMGMHAGGGWWAFRGPLGVTVAPMDVVRRAWTWQIEN